MAFTKPPINADFVNGLWARIGKRARDNERVGLNYEIKCNEPSKMDLKTYLANCIDTTEKDGKKN